MNRNEQISRREFLKIATLGAVTFVIGKPFKTEALRFCNNENLSPHQENPPLSIRAIFFINPDDGKISHRIQNVEVLRSSSFYQDIMSAYKNFNQLLTSQGILVKQTDIYLPFGDLDDTPQMQSTRIEERQKPIERLTIFFTVDGISKNRIDLDGTSLPNQPNQYTTVSGGILFIPEGKTGWRQIVSRTADLEHAAYPGGFQGRIVYQVPNPQTGTLIAYDIGTNGRDTPQRVAIGTPNTNNGRIEWRKVEPFLKLGEVRHSTFENNGRVFRQMSANVNGKMLNIATDIPRQYLTLKTIDVKTLIKNISNIQSDYYFFDPYGSLNRSNYMIRLLAERPERPRHEVIARFQISGTDIVVPYRYIQTGNTVNMEIYINTDAFAMMATDPRGREWAEGFIARQIQMGIYTSLRQLRGDLQGIRELPVFFDQYIGMENLDAIDISAHIP